MAVFLKIKSSHAVQPSNSTPGNPTHTNKNINKLGHVYQDVYSSITYGSKNKCH